MTGSTDKTKDLIESFIEKISNSNLEIKYFYQENQGKMTALNNLITNASSDLLIECDSDDYLKSNAIKIINSKYEEVKDKENIYALAFLKYDQNLCNIGSTFKTDNYETNMFNLYFKDGLLGDKSLVFVTNIRKQYLYKLEKNERFSTEARLYNEMDKKHNVICFNYPIMICEYLKEGYSQNIAKIFKENPYGYYEYFKQILNFDMKDVLFSKRLYAIKHYILFSYLTKNKNILKNIKGTFNKFLVIILYIPGIVKSLFYKKKDC
ncbi:MAG: glycosyltransferase [Clostridiales bacterium]|nr:glycosyltransferase [Clostridiales bacterium]